MSAPTITKITTDVTFSRPLDEGECEMLYEEITEALGREDYGGDFEVLYGGPTAKAGWDITGVRLNVGMDELAQVFDAIKVWLEGAEDLWSCEAL